jgi:hypothetical protein
MKGIAIPYLITLIIGVIILAIGVLLIYLAMKGESWDCQKCRTQFATWCSNCYLKNTKETTWIESGSKLGKTLYDCVTKCGFWTGASGEGQECEGAQDACKPMNVFETG